MSVASKRCHKCGEEKPASGFHRASANGDGLNHRCKSCMKTYSRSWYAKNKERCLQNSNEWAKANREKMNTYVRNRKFLEGEKLKRYARSVVENALSKGWIVRKACAQCGILETEAHHDDYKLALELRWLCKDHHEEAHHGAL